MRMLVSTAIAAALVVVLPACSQQDGSNETNTAVPAAASLDALNGSWKVVLASMKFTGRPDEFLLKDGSYSCASCIPPLTVAADGQFHPVADRPYYDSMSVKMVDDRTVEFNRQKGGKDVSSSRLEASEDGNMLTIRFRNFANPGSTTEGSQTAKRVGAAPAGAHAISGQWEPERLADFNEDALDISYQVEGDTVTYTSQGQSYVATLGGPPVEMKGDVGGTTVKVERADGGIKETFIRGGKEVDVTTIAPSADGKSLSYTSLDPRDGQGSTFTAERKN